MHSLSASLFSPTHSLTASIHSPLTLLHSTDTSSHITLSHAWPVQRLFSTAFGIGLHSGHTRLAPAHPSTHTLASISSGSHYIASQHGLDTSLPDWHFYHPGSLRSTEHMDARQVHLSVEDMGQYGGLSHSIHHRCIPLILALPVPALLHLHSRHARPPRQAPDRRQSGHIPNYVDSLGCGSSSHPHACLAVAYKLIQTHACSIRPSLASAYPTEQVQLMSVS